MLQLSVAKLVASDLCKHTIRRCTRLKHLILTISVAVLVRVSPLSGKSPKSPPTCANVLTNEIPLKVTLMCRLVSECDPEKARAIRTPLNLPTKSTVEIAALRPPLASRVKLTHVLLTIIIVPERLFVSP